MAPLPLSPFDTYLNILLFVDKNGSLGTCMLQLLDVFFYLHTVWNIDGLCLYGGHSLQPLFELTRSSTPFCLTILSSAHGQMPIAPLVVRLPHQHVLHAVMPFNYFPVACSLLHHA